MSFQDVGRPGHSRGPVNDRSGHSATLPNGPSTGGLSVGGVGNVSLNGEYYEVSNCILQYQKNVGILEQIAKSFGTSTDVSTLETQFKVQVDVVRQLASKIEKQLRSHELSLETMSRTDATRSRATLVKLTRDFHRVEMTYKNVLLEARRSRSLIEARKRGAEDDYEQRMRSGNDALGDSNMQLQMQYQNDRIAEEIMREREEEIRKINRGMHQVNEIYKDLAHIVGSQQEQIDNVEKHMEHASRNAEEGLKQIEKANVSASQSSCVIS